MSRTLFGRLACIIAATAFTTGLSCAQVIFSDDFTAADGTALAGRTPPTGQAWTQTAGPAVTIQSGGISTVGAGRALFANFTQGFDGTQRLIKMTVDFTLLTHNGGYAGVSFFDGTNERIFVGDLSGTNPSIGFEIAGGGQVYAAPVTATGVVTLLYDSVTGRTALYSGTTTSGVPLGSTIATPGLHFDRLRVQNGNGGDIGISSVGVEQFAQGSVSVDTYVVDSAIVKQGTPQLLSWSTSFANQVSITPGVGAVDTTGEKSVTVPLGDTTYTLTATDTATSSSASSSQILRAVAGGSSNYRYVRYTTKKVRNDSITTATQLADFRFLNDSGEVIPVDVQNPGGNTPANEGVGNLLDANAATKWYDLNRAPVIFDFGASPAAFNRYYFTTANDAPERDPVRWILEGSNDGTTWTLIDNVTAFDYPTFTTRNVTTPDIPLPGASLIPYTSLVASATSLVSGDSLILYYQASGGDTTTLSDGTTTTALTPGTSSVILHPTQNTTYTVTAARTGGPSISSSVQVTIVNPAITTINYANFDSSSDELSLIGATVVNDFANRPQPGDHKRLRVTDAINSQVNSVWFRKRQNVGQGFDTTFNMQISRTDNGTGADGMAFIVQNTLQGSDLSVQTAEQGTQTQALSIAFDTYMNGAETSAAFLRVATGGAVLGSVDLTTVPGVTLRGTNALMDPTGQGAPYPVHVVYTPGSLSVYFEDILVIDHLAVDLGTIGAVAADGTSYVGFAARTGGLSEAHDITSWVLTTNAAPAVDVKLVSYSVNTATNQVTLTWTSSASKTYRITSSSDLTTWGTQLRTGIQGVAGQTSATVSFTRGAKGFFRVEQE